VKTEKKVVSLIRYRPHSGSLRRAEPVFQGKSGQALQRGGDLFGTKQGACGVRENLPVKEMPGKKTPGLKGTVEVKGCPASTKEIYQELCNHLI